MSGVSSELCGDMGGGDDNGNDNGDDNDNGNDNGDDNDNSDNNGDDNNDNNECGSDEVKLEFTLNTDEYGYVPYTSVLVALKLCIVLMIIDHHSQISHLF